LFELLTGQTPFDGDTLPEVCAAVMHSDPKCAVELCPELPKALSDAIDRCLNKDPSRRFSSIADLAGALVPFGSARAVASLKRIERVLAQTTPASELVNVDPELVTLIAGEPSDAWQSARQIDLKNAATTGAASSMVTAPTQRRPAWKLLAALAILGVAGVGVMSFARRIEHGARAALPLQAASETISEPPAGALIQPASTAPPALPSHDSPSLHEAPVAPASAAAPVAPPAKASRRGPRAGKHPAPEPPTMAPAQSSEPKKTNKATEAWDPASFGPRR
jgi:eukaryotic-like serine/threonine-protein kinase